MQEQLEYLKQNAAELNNLLKDKKSTDYQYLSMLHLNAVAKNLISDIQLERDNQNRLVSLQKCTQIELMTMVCSLQDQLEKQKRELFGLQQSVNNYKEKEAKRYEQSCGSYNSDSGYINRYHSDNDR